MQMKQPKIRFKFKSVLIVVLVLIVVCTTATVVYFVAQNYRQVERSNEAIRVYNQSEWQLAQDLLTRAIEEDPNNEELVVKLATVYEKLDSWTEAGIVWSRASKLNAFKSEYVESMLDAYVKGDAIGLLRNELERMQPLQKARHQLIFAYAVSRTGSASQANEILGNIKDEDLLRSPLGQLVAVYSDTDPSMTSEKVSKLNELTKSEDKSVAYSALFTLADYYLRSGGTAKAESYLKQRISIRPTNGAMSLANFYYFQGRMSDAAPIYRDNVDALSPVEAVRFAEVLAAIESIDELKSFAKRYRLGSREAVLTGFYIDALLAYQAGDMALLSSKLDALGDELPPTALAELLKLSDAIATRDFNSISSIIQRLPLADNEIINTYVSMLEPLVAELLEANEFEPAAQISTLALRNNQADVIFSLAVILDAAQKNVLSQRELERALEAYPNDPRMLSLAVDVFLRKGDVASATRYVDQLLERSPENVSARLQKISVLELSGKVEQVAAQFSDLFYANPQDHQLLVAYLAFCTRNERLEALQTLATSLSPKGAGSGDGASALVEAELANLKGDREAVNQSLKPFVENLKLTSVNTAIQYRAANLLAGNDFYEPAITIYRKLQTQVPGDGLILANLSEIYAARGAKTNSSSDLQLALELSEEAYRLNPNSNLALECYAVRLYENANYETVEKLLYPPLQKGNASVRGRDTWKASVEKLIEELASKGELERRSTLSQLLLREFPGNPIAQSNLASIQETKQKQEAAAIRKSDQDLPLDPSVSQ